MENEPEMEIVEQVNKWCAHCRLYATKYFIYNADPSDLEAIATEVFEALPGRLAPAGWERSIKKIFNNLPPHYFKEIKAFINDMPLNSGTQNPFDDEVKE